MKDVIYWNSWYSHFAGFLRTLLGVLYRPKEVSIWEMLRHWENKFRLDATSDHYAGLDDHLQQVCAGTYIPELSLEATIHIVRSCCVYASMGGSQYDVKRFMSMQQYSTNQHNEKSWVFTFDLGNSAYARVVLEQNSTVLDLADLMEHPWDDMKSIGFYRLYINKCTWDTINEQEATSWERLVKEDLYADYDEDELDIYVELSDERNYIDIDIVPPWMQMEEE